MQKEQLVKDLENVMDFMNELNDTNKKLSYQHKMNILRDEIRNYTTRMKILQEIIIPEVVRNREEAVMKFLDDIMQKREEYILDDIKRALQFSYDEARISEFLDKVLTIRQFMQE
jgi:hypothetical protein